MLIRYQDRRIVDYGVFAPKAPYYSSIEAVESSVLRTSLSGNIPASITMLLEDGTVLHTKKFVVTDLYNSEFRILDRDLYQIFAPKLKQQGHYGEILDVLLLCDNCSDRVWSILVQFNDVLDDFSDGVEFFDVKRVIWSVESNAGA